MLSSSKRFFPKGLKRFLSKSLRSRNLAIIFSILSVISVMATYFAITDSDYPLGYDFSNKVMSYIIADLILLLCLASIISKRLISLWIERRRKSVGSRLQTRIVIMFSAVAIIPSVLMAIFALLSFNYGVQSWFDEKVRTAIDGSVEISKLYLEEHKKIIGSDILGMAADLNRDTYNIRKNPRSFSSKLSLLATIRKLPEAIVFQKNNERNTILARTKLSFSLSMILEEISEDAIKKAKNGELIILTNEADDRVMAMVRLENFFDTYLLVGRFVDNKIIELMKNTEGAANQYNKLKNDVSSLQIKFFVTFIIASSLLLFAVIWLGFIFASTLVSPVRGLISATERVKEGDFNARVPEGHENDELATLGRAFNLMIRQLERQRKDLISAQRRSAWSDVARRIAHEIKNPLTPIQLATDRLRKKYEKGNMDAELFNKYLNTISKNVNSIGSMVEEFVGFARIPTPIFSDCNISEIMGDAIFAIEGNLPYIKIQYNKPRSQIIVNCDANQILRVATNLLKNSIEAIEDRKNGDKGFTDGFISVNLFIKDDFCFVDIIDNGCGFSDSMIDNIIEPYVTTKSKGTGLGLAIVKKIIEDHDGDLVFSNIEGGACVSLSFPLKRDN